MSALSLSAGSDAGGRIGAVPPLAWLGLQTLALWPHWHWMAGRLLDGSDDPLGVIALVVLAGRMMWLRQRLRIRPRPLWLGGAMLLTVGATLALTVLPPLAGALVAVLALVAALGAFLPGGTALVPLAGLAVLALPLLSSLQFYAGFPLRILTAQASLWGLQLAGFSVERFGAALQVDGRLIIVDAPCSGVQMLWLGYFSACALAVLRRLDSRAFLHRLPWVGVLVLAGNIVRNSVLVVLELRLQTVSETVHQGVGLAVLLLVCLAVAGVIREQSDGQ